MDWVMMLVNIHLYIVNKKINNIFIQVVKSLFKGKFYFISTYP